MLLTMLWLVTLCILTATLLVLSNLHYMGTVSYKGFRYRISENLDALDRLHSLRLVSLDIADQVGDGKLKRKIRKCVFSERDSESSDVAFTLDKGKEMVFCLKGDNKYVTNYILVHEMAHIASKSVGHTEEFYRELKKLTSIAIKLGFLEKNCRRISFCDRVIVTT